MRQLRQLDIPVAEVGELLADLDRGASVAERLEAHLRTREEHLGHQRQLLDHILDRLGGKRMTVPVSLSVLRHRPALYTSAHISAGELQEFAREALARLHAEVARYLLVLPRPLYIRYHGELADPSARTDVDLCLPYDDEQTQPGPLPDGIGVLPGEPQRYASTRVRGRMTAYPDILEGYDAVARWITGHGFEIAGPAIEIYWRWCGTAGDDRNELEIGFPVAG